MPGLPGEVGLICSGDPAPANSPFNHGREGGRGSLSLPAKRSRERIVSDQLGTNYTTLVRFFFFSPLFRDTIKDGTVKNT